MRPGWFISLVFKHADVFISFVGWIWRLDMLHKYDILLLLQSGSRSSHRGLLLPVENNNNKFSTELCMEEWSKFSHSFLSFNSTTVLKQEVKGTLLLVQLALVQDVTMSCELEFECRMKRLFSEGQTNICDTAKYISQKRIQRKEYLHKRKKWLKGTVHPKVTLVSFTSYFFIQLN